jgi:beta-lactamase class C
MVPTSKLPNVISNSIRQKQFYILSAFILSILIIVLFRNNKPAKQFGQGTDSLSSEHFAIHPAVVNYINFLEALLDSSNNVGAAITIVYRKRTQITKTYGVKLVGTTDSVDNYTVFRLASVSKGFAGVLACILEEEGILSLEDKVINFLPGLKLKDSVNTDDLNIKHTLSHTSGLVPHAYDNLIEDGVPLSKILDQLSVVDISAPPGVLYSYQNVMFSLIDTVGVKLTGSSYPELLSKKIFGPLKMRHASANAKIFSRKRGNYAFPHARRDTSYFALPVNKGYYNIAPAAGVNASIDDMNKWLLALLGNEPQVIDSAILDQITTPVIISPLKRRYTRSWDRIDSKYYSLGWRIYMYKGYKIIYHGGYVEGYRAEVAFCPEEELGMVFLQNSPNRVASVSVPALFNIWIAAKDSANTDSENYPVLPEFNFLDDSVPDVDGKFKFVPESIEFQ